MALLEYVETSLCADNVVVRLVKKQAALSEVVRLFMFFGFAPVTPGHPLLSAVPGNDMYISLAYQVN